MEAFKADNRCPQCGGDASTKYHHHNVGCSRIPGSHMHRRCEDCGFSWGELPIGRPLGLEDVRQASA